MHCSKWLKCYHKLHTITFSSFSSDDIVLVKVFFSFPNVTEAVRHPPLVLTHQTCTFLEQNVPSDNSWLLFKEACLCSERLFSNNSSQPEVMPPRSEILSLAHPLIVALPGTERLFEMTSDSSLRLRFVSHSPSALV